MTKIFKYLILFLPVIVLAGCDGTREEKLQSENITVENDLFRLVISKTGEIINLTGKTSGEEYLMPGVRVKAFGITQYVPYDNENKLTFPAKKRTFYAREVRREGNRLIVRFDRTDYEAVVRLRIQPFYIGFTLESLNYRMAKVGDKRKTNVDEFILFQLPVKDRSHFGEWLNVMWDDRGAVNLLATDPTCRIDAFSRPGYHIFQAAAVREVRLEGTGAALVAAPTEKLLDIVDTIETDYDLPAGVKSRRSEEYRYSYYEMHEVTPETIDKHIAYALKGGFHQMVIYYPAFAKSMGHFPWRREYPHGLDDLKKVVRKIRDAGMTVGFHIHYNKAQINDPYVTPVPDPRLNIRRYFSLREKLTVRDTTLTVEENPAGCTLEKGRRLLRVGREIISYRDYTTVPPYRFIGCRRGVLGTRPVSRPKGDLLGLLDVDTWPLFIRFNQRTNIQQEVAERIARLYDGAGFQFIYFDGAEDVPPPYWYNVAQAQMVVYDHLKRKTLFAEGAQKAHFSWHLLTRGNAFDDYPPEYFKEGIRRYQMAEAPLIYNDFSSIDFGWITPFPPDNNTIGLQPDMIEYAESRAYGWDAVISIVGHLDMLERNPRTDDILEIIRRWEEVREKKMFSEKEKALLQDLLPEHFLFLNGKGEYELIAYLQVTGIPANIPIRAFLFQRKGEPWIVYWHTRGEGKISLPVTSSKIELYEEGLRKVPVEKKEEVYVIPAGRRRYIRFETNEKEAVNIFRKIKLIH